MDVVHKHCCQAEERTLESGIRPRRLSNVIQRLDIAIHLQRTGQQPRKKTAVVMLSLEESRCELYAYLYLAIHSDFR